MKLIRRLFSLVSHFLNFIAIGAFTGGMSYLLNVWTGCPRGNDAGGHVFKVKVIAQFWPHFNWTHSWAGGMPQFLKYPSLPYIPLALIHRHFGVNVGMLLTVAGVAAVAASAIGVYLLVWELTRTRLVSLVSALVYSLTPASWSYAFSGGIYARAFASPFLVLALWSFVRLLKAGEEKRKDKVALFLTVVFLAISTLNHYVIGALAFVLIFILGLLVIRGLKQKFILPLKIFLPATLLTAIFSLPFLLSRPTTRQLGGLVENIESVPWHDLLYLLDKNLEYNNLFNRLSPFLLPLSLVLLVTVLVFRRKRLVGDYFLFRVFLFLAIASLVLFVWVKTIFPFLSLLYVIVGIPVGMLHYLAILLAPLVGILLFLITPSGKLTGKLKFLPSLIVLLMIGIWVKFQLFDVVGDLGINRFKPRCDYSPLFQEVIEEVFSEHDQQFNFRLGVKHAGTGSWFNTRFPYVPQTRDYFGQGVVDHDQRFYLIYSLFHESDNYQETNFLIDWWAIKQILVEWRDEVGEKYVSKPELYRLLGSDKMSFDIFEFENPSPILAASNTLPILFIGKSDSYKIFFRDFAPANLNSEYFISVHDKEFIDDYTSKELEKFPVIVLYDYRYKNQDKTINLLKAYLEGGGGIVIEGQEQEKELVQVLPLARFEKKDFGKDWQLSQTEEGNEILGEVDLSAFGPAVFDEGSWEVSVVSETKEWGKPLLLEADRPILIAGEKEGGRIIWSGLNLPYHIATYESEEESKLLGKLIAWAGKVKEKEAVNLPFDNNSLVYEAPSFKAEFIHPEKRILTLKKPSAGVLFKEFYFPNWRASLERGGKREKLEIYKAGPEFMYIPGPFFVGDELTLSYELSFWPYKVGTLVSLITAGFLIIYLFKAKIPFVPPTSRFVSQWSSGLSNWWEKDE